MSLDICQIALHQLIKRDEQTLEVVLRDSLLGTDNIVHEMMAELHRIYGAKSKAFATFNQASKLAEALVSLRKGDENFWDLVVRQQFVCGMNWQNIHLQKVGWYCFVNIVI